MRKTFKNTYNERGMCEYLNIKIRILVKVIGRNYSQHLSQRVTRNNLKNCSIYSDPNN